MPDIKTIADKADIIVNGYAFTREGDPSLLRIIIRKCTSAGRSIAIKAIMRNKNSSRVLAFLAWWLLAP